MCIVETLRWMNHQACITCEPSGNSESYSGEMASYYSPSPLMPLTSRSRLNKTLAYWCSGPRRTDVHSYTRNFEWVFILFSTGSQPQPRSQQGSFYSELLKGKDMSAVLFMKVPYAHPRSQVVVFPRQVSERSSSPRQELF